MYDPWDQDRFSPHGGYYHFRLLPHAAMRNAERARLAAEFGGFIGERDYGKSGPRQIPECFGALEVANASNVLATALFRESLKAGEHLPDWAGHDMARASGGACTHPYVIRLVEYDGESADVILKLPGEVALAAKTNLMGETQQWLKPEPTSPPEWARGAHIAGREVTWSAVRFSMGPREIGTVMADLVLGRKQYRDLDAKREIWATVHRT
jgi:alpha-mannosidase